MDDNRRPVFFLGLLEAVAVEVLLGVGLLGAVAVAILLGAALLLLLLLLLVIRYTG